MKVRAIPMLFVVLLVVGFVVLVTTDDEPRALDVTSSLSDVVPQSGILLNGGQARAGERGFYWPVICEMPDGSPAAGANLSVSRKSEIAGVDPVGIGVWKSDDQGRLRVFIPESDNQRVVSVQFELRHATDRAMVLVTGAALSPPVGRILTRGDAAPEFRDEWIQRLRFPSTRGVVGYVVERTGEPVPFAYVRWCSAEGIEEGIPAMTREDGLFVLPRRRGFTHISAQARDFHRRVVREASEEENRIVVSRRGVVRGRVVDERGEPVVGAVVDCSVMGEALEGETPRPSTSSRPDRWLSRQAYCECGPRHSDLRTWKLTGQTHTDEKGDFAVPFAVGGGVRAVVRAEGHDVIVMNRSEGEWDLGETVAIESSLHGLLGRVVDERDQPVAGINVHFVRDPYDAHQVHVGTRTTDGDGHFSLSGLPHGETLTVSFAEIPGKPPTGLGSGRPQQVKIDRDLLIRK